MVYTCEFEFYESGGYIDAVPLNGLEGGTFGADLEDAVASAIDWLSELVDDALLNNKELPPVRYGAVPSHGGRVIALAVSRSLEDIPCMSASDAARYLGVSPARIKQLCDAGLLDSWKSGARRLVTKASVEARREYAMQRAAARARASA